MASSDNWSSGVVPTPRRNREPEPKNRTWGPFTPSQPPVSIATLDSLSATVFKCLQWCFRPSYHHTRNSGKDESLHLCVVISVRLAGETRYPEPIRKCPTSARGKHCMRESRLAAALPAAAGAADAACCISSALRPAWHRTPLVIHGILPLVNSPSHPPSEPMGF